MRTNACYPGDGGPSVLHIKMMARTKKWFKWASLSDQWSIVFLHVVCLNRLLARALDITPLQYALTPYSVLSIYIFWPVGKHLLPIPLRMSDRHHVEEITYPVTVSARQFSIFIFLLFFITRLVLVDNPIKFAAMTWLSGWEDDL